MFQQFENASTGSYTALISKEGDMTYGGLADMGRCLTTLRLGRNLAFTLIEKAKRIIVDLNLGKEVLNFMCSYHETSNQISYHH